MRGLAKAVLFTLIAVPVVEAIEVSTGYLIGPKYDARAIYVRTKGTVLGTR